MDDVCAGAGDDGGDPAIGPAKLGWRGGGEDAELGDGIGWRPEGVAGIQAIDVSHAVDEEGVGLGTLPIDLVVLARATEPGLRCETR